MYLGVAQLVARLTRKWTVVSSCPIEGFSCFPDLHNQKLFVSQSN